MRLLLCLGLVVVFAVGCGAASAGVDGGVGGGSAGGSAGANSVTGSVNGRGLVIASAAATRGTSSLIVRLSEHTATCDPNGTIGLSRAEKRIVSLFLSIPDGGTVAPGQFIADELRVEVPDCTSSMTGSAGVSNPLTLLDNSTRASASITLVEVGSRARGTFSAMLSSGATLSGSFDAEFCNFGGALYSRVKCN